MDNKGSCNYKSERNRLRARGSRILAVLISFMMIFSASVFAETAGADGAAASDEQGSVTVDVVTDGIDGDLAVEEDNDDDPDLEDDEDADDGIGEDVQPTGPSEPAAPSEFGAPVVSKAVDGNLLVLTWAAVPDADGYLAKVWAEGETEPADEAAVSVNGTSYSFELGTANTYYYKIGAVRYPEAAPETPADTGTADGSAEPAQQEEPAPQPAPEIAWSETGTYTAPVFSAPVISSLKLRYGANDNGVIINWTMTNTTGVVSYDIMCGTSRQFNTMKKIATVAAGKLTYNYLQDKAGTYYYAVRAVSDAGEYRVSPVSSKLTVMDKWILKTHGLVWYGTTKSKVNLVKSAGSKTKVTTLKKGTKVTAIGKSPKKVAKFHQPTWVKVKTSDGKTGWLKYSQLKGGVKATVNIKKDYTRSVKED
ncbi:MAG: SH3 domain-containing protein, partial [Mogibacterium sp.]|nr:SH3 domain-containing protein [Mogibacterium sp.]